MGRKLDTVLSIILVLSAVATTAFLGYRVLGSERNDAVRSQTQPEYIEGWPDLLEAGVSLIGRDEPIQVIEFGDLECPACRAFFDVLDSVLRDGMADVGITWIHYPLPYHRFAMPAARAFECAALSGHAMSFVRAVFQAQDSLGLIDWEEYAKRAGVPDAVSVATCATRSETPARISRGIRAGESVEVTGTPTVVINGWRFAQRPSQKDLRVAIQAVRAGQEVFAEYRRRHVGGADSAN